MRRKRNLKIFKALFLAVLVFVMIGQIVLVNSFSAEGEKIRMLEEQKREFFDRKAFLREEIAALGSLERIRAEAEKSLGMKNGEEVMEFLVPPKLAAR